MLTRTYRRHRPDSSRLAKLVERNLLGQVTCLEPAWIERMASEVFFAALCGASPVEASSGKTQRRRLDRGGDRQANAALYRIVLTRLRWDLHTRTYLDRRTSDGKSRREAIRCLKRYVARELYPLLRAASASTDPDTTTA